MEGKYTVDTISKYILKYYENDRGESITNLRLQKLLYFVQVEFIKKNTQGAFKEEIEAWSFGPVVPEIYRKYKLFGNESIVPNPVNSILCNFNTNMYEKITTADKEVINKVLEEAARMPTAELARISVIQKPFKDAYNRGETIITKESIYDYFVGDCEQE